MHAASVHKDTHLAYSQDTDVFLLLVHHIPAILQSTTFYTGKGRQKRYISVQDIYLKLGQRCSAAILRVHSLTGYDTTGKFWGRTEDWCFKVFLSCGDRILDSLGHVGKEVLEPYTWAQMERFVCLIYKSKLHTAVKDLVGFFFSNRAAEGENLPPAFSALYLHILQANFF